MKKEKLLMEPLISVIIPIYNVEKYLKKCIDSVIAQTYKNLEIILVDDGSPDNCGKICDEYAKKDRRIIVIHKENEGLSSARNAGIDICKGEYISFVDSDDFVSPYFIEMLYRGVHDYNCEIATVAHGVNFVDGQDDSVIFAAYKSHCSYEEIKPREAIRLMMYQKLPNGAQWRLYKREIWNDLRFPVGWLYEDAATIHNAFMKATQMVIVHASIYAYRIRQNSIIRMTFSPSKLVCIDVGEKIVKEVTDYDKTLYAAACSRAFAVNYTVFLQVPKTDKVSMMKIWTEIKKYRRTVLNDISPKVRFKNRVGAAVSYLGMDAAWRIGRKYIGKN